MTDELQHRALAIAVAHFRAVEENTQEFWDVLWLKLGDEVGWANVGLIDRDLLRTQISEQLERDRLRQAGLSDEQIEEQLTRKRARALTTNSCPGEPLDIVGWVGPLISENARRTLKSKERELRRLKAQGVGLTTSFHLFPLGSLWLGASFDQRFESALHPRDADPAHVLALLKSQGAPRTCRMLLFAGPSRYDDEELGFALPLTEAIEFALSEGDGYQLILLCVPGRLAYWQDDHHNRVIVHRTSS